MSHFKFYAPPEPVETRHDDIYVGIGTTDDGTESVGIVVTADDGADVHLSPEQAEALIRQLAACASSMRLYPLARVHARDAEAAIREAEQRLAEAKARAE